jgi:hypothetical protein
MNDEINTDGDQPNPAKAAEIAQQIVRILIGEDSETRKRAMRAAVTLLGDGSLKDDTSPVRAPQSGGVSLDEPAELATFFSRQDDLRPSDNAQLCAAYHFSLHGPVAFSLEELRTIAGEAGVVLPDRLDMTLNAATSKGRKLFQPVGRGMFKPTAAAGIVFKERWGVRPGKQLKAGASPAIE